MWHSRAFIQQCLNILQPKIDVLDPYRCSPLHYAVIFGNSGAIKVLLDAGADSNRLDSACSVPIHYAQPSRCFKGVEFLLRAGADSERLDRFGRSTLHLALRSEDPELINAAMRSIESKPEDIKTRTIHKTNIFGQTVSHRICLWGASNSQSLEGTSIEEEPVDSDVEEIESTSATSVISSKCEKYIRALRLLGAKVNARDSHGCATSYRGKDQQRNCRRSSTAVCRGPALHQRC